ncbi:MAG: hypothetical protein LBJ00_13580 [Planctomycetaceae bacterium]|nr:hypothetical protein [Planctomycetaceae bacterium]
MIKELLGHDVWQNLNNGWFNFICAKLFLCRLNSIVLEESFTVFLLFSRVWQKRIYRASDFS